MALCVYRVSGVCLFSAYTAVFNGWDLFLNDMGLVGSEEAAVEAWPRAIYMSCPLLVVTLNRVGKTFQKTTYRASMLAKLPRRLVRCGICVTPGAAAQVK